MLQFAVCTWPGLVALYSIFSSVHSVTMSSQQIRTENARGNWQMTSERQRKAESAFESNGMTFGPQL